MTDNSEIQMDEASVQAIKTVEEQFGPFPGAKVSTHEDAFVVAPSGNERGGHLYMVRGARAVPFQLGRTTVEEAYEKATQEETLAAEQQEIVDRARAARSERAARGSQPSDLPREKQAFAIGLADDGTPFPVTSKADGDQGLA